MFSDEPCSSFRFTLLHSFCDVAEDGLVSSACSFLLPYTVNILVCADGGGDLNEDVAVCFHDGSSCDV